MAVEVRISNGPLYVDIDGFRLSKGFILEEFRSALRYQTRADDNFVVTFPKCGTTWTTYIAYLIFHGSVPPASLADLIRSSPFLESHGAEFVKNMDRPGLIKTHLPYRLIPKHPQAKYLYVCRNPKDVCVSFFHHTRTIGEYDFHNGSFDVFFELFMAGDNEHGDYFDHVLSWYEHRNDPNVLFVHYEEMKQEPRKHILKMAEFFGEEYHKPLLENDSLLHDIVNYSAFEEMKENTINLKDFSGKPLQLENIPKSLYWFDNESFRSSYMNIFMRKGVVGGWRAHFTSTMNERMEQKMIGKLTNTDILNVWKKHNVLKSASTY